MTSSKLGSELKRLISGAGGADDHPLHLLVRLRNKISADDEKALNAMGGHVRARAGEIVTMTLPLGQVAALVESEAVVSVEAAQPLYPDISLTNKED
jgi:hypothetical protein